MNIAFDAKRAFHNHSGLGNYSRDLIRGLQKNFPNNNYTLYTPKPAKDMFISEAESMQVVTPPNGYGKLRQSHWRSFKLAQQAASDGQDIYHGLSNELPKNIHRVGVKSVVTIHDLIFMRHPEWYKPIDRIIYQKKFRYASQVANRVIAVSEQTKSDLLEYFSISPEKIDVIYQSCHSMFHQKHTDSEKNEFREVLQLPSEFLLYVGTVEKRKNLLSIVKALHTQQIDIPLVILGRQTAYAKTVKEYIAANGIEQIYFLNDLPFESFPLIYQMATALVYPSVFEGFGIPILEALVSGIPVITSKGGCFSEAGGEGSIYVDPYDIGELSDAIQKVITDSELRDRMIKAGLKHAEKFESDKLAKQVMELYKTLV